MGDRPQLSLVIPARDEAEGIERTVKALDAGLSCAGLRFEMIVVDDGSRDGTRPVAESLLPRLPRLRVIAPPPPRGYGAAIRAGFAAAVGDVVGYTDADLPVSPEEIAAAARTVLDGGADAVIGVRARLNEGGIYRRVQSAAWNGLCRRVLGIESSDVNFSLKLMRRDVIESLRLTSRFNFVDAEIQIELARGGYRVARRRCEHQPRTSGRSSLGGPIAALTCLAETCAHIAARVRRGSAFGGPSR